MRTYIQRSDGTYCYYEGMTLDHIDASLEAMGLSGMVVSEAEFFAQVK